MQKIRTKLMVLLMGMVMLAAGMLLSGIINVTSVSAAPDETAVCEHEYGDGVVHEPTCTAEGYTEYICTLCGASYKDEFTDRAEHTYSEVVVEPTCTHEGYTTHFCTVCGYEYTDGYTAATGHTYQDTTTLPTCTEPGYSTHTCLACGYSYSDARTQPLGHSYETEVLAPTCTAGGYTTYTCTVCEYSYRGDETAATGHAYAANTVNPTCTMYGYTEHVCANCADRYVTNYVKAPGHDYETEVVEATEDCIGYTKHICKNCKYSYVSDFVTSGDNGYIGGGEHTHEYVFEMEKDDEGKCLIITYLCECGAEYGGKLEILFTDTEENVRQMQPDEHGVVDYSGLTGEYIVTISAETGELLAYFEITTSADMPEEHVHTFVFETENNAEERYFTIRYACACGEKYTGTIYISYSSGAGEVGTLTSNEDGIVDYSMMEGTYHITIETESEILGEFELVVTTEPEEPETPGEGEQEEPEQPEDGDGGKEEKPEEPEQPEEPETPGTGEEETPGVGDENAQQEDEPAGGSAMAIVLPVLLVVLAAFGVTLVIAIKKKNKKDKN